MREALLFAPTVEDVSIRTSFAGITSRLYSADVSQATSQEQADTGKDDDLVQMLAVYHVDLMAELEGLLRSLTRTQAQIERLRSGDPNDSQRREAINLLTGNLKTFASKLDTLRDTMPEILKTAERLQRSESGDEPTE